MIISFLTSTILSAFILLPTIKTPLSITLTIILIRLITSILFRISISSWFAFLIFLIYVSGILVIFAYFTATTPNQSKIRIKSIIYTIMIIISINFIIIYYFISIPLIIVQKYQIISIFSLQNILILIIITIILLFTIVVVVKLTVRSKGPLRVFK